MPRTSVVVAALAVSLLAASCSGGPEFSTKVASSDPVEGEQASVGDDSRVAIGADGGERIVVQWREPGGTRWTKPKTLAEGPGLEASELTLKNSGSIAVAGLAWYAADDDERENFARRDAAVCFAYDCDVVKDVHGGTWADGKGEFVAVGAEEDSLEFDIWTSGGDGWGTLTVSGPPTGEGFEKSSDVVLLADASFATVVGRLDGGECSFELWKSKPRTGELVKVAATEPRVQGSCTAEARAARRDAVEFYDRTTDQHITFSRTGSTWTNDQTEAGPLAIDAAAGLPMILTDLRDGGGTVAVGSPDGRTIVAQHRPERETDWSPPVTVAKASEGQECQSTESETLLDSPDVMYLVQCWPQGSAWGDEYDDAPVPTSGFAVASPDGRRWVSEPLERPAYEPYHQEIEPLMLARGGDHSLVWRAGAKEFEEITLPLENPTVDGMAITGDTAIRVTGNPDRSKMCRPTWSVAPLTATSWGPKKSLGPTPEWIDGPEYCYGSVGDLARPHSSGQQGREFRVAAIIGNGGFDGVLTRTARGWRFTKERP
jgi:hypothetical protein